MDAEAEGALPRHAACRLRIHRRREHQRTALSGYAICPAGVPLRERQVLYDGKHTNGPESGSGLGEDQGREAGNRPGLPQGQALSPGRDLLPSKHGRGNILEGGEHQRLYLCILQLRRPDEQRSGVHPERQDSAQPRLERGGVAEFRLQLQQGAELQAGQQHHHGKGPLCGGLSGRGHNLWPLRGHRPCQRTLQFPAQTRCRSADSQRPQRPGQLPLVPRHDHSPVHGRLQHKRLLETAPAQRQRRLFFRKQGI